MCRLRRRNVGPQKCWNFLDISIRDRDPNLSRRFHVTSRPVGKNIKGRKIEIYTLYCYKHGKSLPSNASLMVGKRVLQGYVWENRRNGAIDPRPWRPFWRQISRQNVGSEKKL
ncbi:hypothetical protein AVEN_70320-1 [Araneus ventricosus]|uniref:Uncharacterized protein n=1 Tax=Araneus ventricosus TaxID=182803 RepID=A0A4Y1ZSI8_ARAVE|nr:hypothetical protein AVEN_70320-1 [Araneus ventricosus]